MKFFRDIPPGDIFPKGYGFCWYRFDCMLTRTCPVPLNWPARFFRDAYYYLAAAKFRSRLEFTEKLIEMKMVLKVAQAEKDHQDEINQIFKEVVLDTWAFERRIALWAASPEGEKALTKDGKALKPKPPPD